MALMLTACVSTTPPMVTNSAAHTVEIPVMPNPPAELLIAPVKPEPLRNGAVTSLLNHTIEMGAYVGELENQNAAWRAWATHSKGAVNEP